MTDLLYNDVEESLRESLRAMLDDMLTGEHIAQLYDAPDSDVGFVWDAFSGQLDLAGLLIPESMGGSGASAREAAVVLEELGRSLAPAPFLTSSVIAASALMTAGDATLLPELARGSIAALVLPWTTRAGHWQPQPPSTPTSLVAGAQRADYFLVPSLGANGVQLRMHGTATVEPVTSLDMSRPLSTVTPYEDGEVIAEGDLACNAVDAALAAGAGLLASEQLGIAQWCLENTVEYAKNRIQFARPIGSFQAIKHRLADLYLAVVQAQAAARHAADTLANGDADASIAQAVAQSHCSQTAVTAAEEALQLHGGIGMTWEHHIHLYLKRAKSDQLALGTASQHRYDLSALVDLPTA